MNRVAIIEIILNSIIKRDRTNSTRSPNTTATEKFIVSEDFCNERGTKANDTESTNKDNTWYLSTCCLSDTLEYYNL